MRGTTIPKGSISIHTFPLHPQGSAYRTHCGDYKVNLFIEPPNGLEPYFEEASKNWGSCKGAEHTYTPCVIGRRTHRELSHHQAGLLAPPNVTKESELFVPGLAVSDLKIERCIGSSHDPKGYFLSSVYMGGQEFYVPPIPMLMELSSFPDIVFQGRIGDTYNLNERKRPKIYLTIDSKNNPEIFIQNREKLAEIRGSSETFWWDIELDNNHLDL